jgi:hypothetical protein
MKRKFIVAGVIVIMTICDVISCLNFHGNEWKWDTGPRISDFIRFAPDSYSHEIHVIKKGKKTQGYLILSMGKHALLYVTEGKDVANPRGLSIYIKL